MPVPRSPHRVGDGVGGGAGQRLADPAVGEDRTVCVCGGNRAVEDHRASLAELVHRPPQESQQLGAAALTCSLPFTSAPTGSAVPPAASITSTAASSRPRSGRAGPRRTRRRPPAAPSRHRCRGRPYSGQRGIGAGVGELGQLTGAGSVQARSVAALVLPLVQVEGQLPGIRYRYRGRMTSAAEPLSGGARDTPLPDARFERRTMPRAVLLRYASRRASGIPRARWGTATGRGTRAEVGSVVAGPGSPRARSPLVSGTR